MKRFIGSMVGVVVCLGSVTASTELAPEYRKALQTHMTSLKARAGKLQALIASMDPGPGRDRLQARLKAMASEYRAHRSELDSDAMTGSYKAVRYCQFCRSTQVVSVYCHRVSARVHPRLRLIHTREDCNHTVIVHVYHCDVCGREVSKGYW